MENQNTKNDLRFLKTAISLGYRSIGHTWPNPSVGCVIVKNNHIIGTGNTAIKGRPHAEKIALDQAKSEALNSTVYVTLEPCCHHGVTPPCTDLIVKSKISEVIYSVSDIDIRVRNKSFKILRSKKIKIRKGLLEEKVKNFYSTYFFNRKKKLPYVTGKIAVSKNNLISVVRQRRLEMGRVEGEGHMWYVSWREIVQR